MSQSLQGQRGHARVSRLVRRQLGSVALALITAAGTSGCGTVFHPYVDVPKLELAKQPEGKTRFVDLAKAIGEVEDLRTAVQANRNEVVKTRTILGLATFGLAGGAAAAAAFGAARDVTLGLGGGAAGTYAGATLYAKPEKSAAYETANQVLACVTDIGAQAIATWDGIKPRQGMFDKTREDALTLLNEVEIDWSKSESGTPEDNTANAAAKAKAIETIAAYDVATANFTVFEGLDPVAAQRVRHAAREIIKGLNKALAAAEPSLDTILNSAKGLGKMAASFAPETPKAAAPGEPKLASAAAKRAPTAKERADLLAHAADLMGEAGNIRRQVADATNALDDIGTRCSFTAPPVPPLKASQTEVTLNKDSKAVVTFDGGALPLTAAWVDTPPPDAVDYVLGSRELVLIGKSGIKPGSGPFKLRVSDSRALPEQVIVTVKMPPKT